MKLILCFWAMLSPFAHGEPYPILERLVKFGSRHAGAPKRAEAISRLKKMLKERGLAVSEDSFESPDPKSGRPWPMTNLVGRFRPEAPCRFLVGTHFDTRHVAEEDKEPRNRNSPIPGANDGGSGVAVLLSLAARFKALAPAGVGVDVILFDGEEMGYPGVGGYCAGSRRYARRLPLSALPAKAGAPKTPRFGVILDMICAPDGVYKVESYSLKHHPALVDALWDIGERRMGAAFSRDEWGSILDDQVPLTEAGIPSVLVIGFNYPQWHTLDDALPRCSAERLRDMESILVEFVSKRSRDFLKECLGSS